MRGPIHPLVATGKDSKSLWPTWARDVESFIEVHVSPNGKIEKSQVQIFAAKNIWQLWPILCNFLVSKISLNVSSCCLLLYSKDSSISALSIAITAAYVDKISGWSNWELIKFLDLRNWMLKNNILWNIFLSFLSLKVLLIDCIWSIVTLCGQVCKILDFLITIKKYVCKYTKISSWSYAQIKNRFARI